MASDGAVTRQVVTVVGEAEHLHRLTGRQQALRVSMRRRVTVLGLRRALALSQAALGIVAGERRQVYGGDAKSADGIAPIGCRGGCRCGGIRSTAGWSAFAPAKRSYCGRESVQKTPCHLSHSDLLKRSGFGPLLEPNFNRSPEKSLICKPLHRLGERFKGFVRRNDSL